MKTMKKYSILLSATLAILALASCQKEQDIVNEETPNVEVIDNTPTSVPFVLRADIPSVNSEEPSGPETKTTLNTSTWAVDWESTDVIYAVTTDKAWGQDYTDDNSGATIAEFAYDSEKGTFSTDMAIADGSHTFNFLYTAGQQKSFHRGASTTFSLAGTQTFDASAPTASLKLYDALAAQVTATTPTTFADVDMSHLFTLMKVTLKNKTGASVNISKFEVEIPGENLYGIFDVTFGTTPSAAYNRSGGDKITVNITNGTVANNGSLDVYFVMGPVSGYTGEVTFTVTDSADNTYTKTNTIPAPGVTFAAGTYNTASYTFKAGVSYPTIDNTSSDYSTGFETDFTAGTTYNNTSVKVDGPSGQQWGSYYGTASTNSALTGSNSMQMRWYTGTPSNLGYAETNFFIAKVGYVSFSATATNDLKIGLYYKGSSDPDWTLAETFTPTTTKDTYTHSFVTPIDNARIRFMIVLPATQPASRSDLIIDDVIVKPVAPAPSISVTTSAATATSSLDGTTATLNGSLALLYGAVNASVTEAGFYYKLTSAGAYNKVTCASAPTSTTTFSYDLTSLTKGSEYTFYAYAIYDGGSEVTGETATFTPTQSSGSGPTNGTVLFSETFGSSAVAPFSDYTGTGSTSYNNASTLSYSCKSSNTKIMNDTQGACGPANLLIGGKNGGSGEWAKISGIKPYGAKSVTVTWASNGTVADVSIEESSSDAVRSAATADNSGTFTLSGSEETITLVITASSKSNTRVDSFEITFNN